MLDPDRQVKMTVGLGKTRNSTNGSERIDFAPAVNATSAAITDRGLAKESTPTQYAHAVSQQP